MVPRKRLQSGRINLRLLFIAFAALTILALGYIFSQESLNTVASRFMSALATGDVNTLSENSYLGTESKDEIHKQWDYAVNDVAKYYRFTWRITGSMQQSEDSGAVRLSVAKNADGPGAYEENFALPVIKVNGKWLVDVRNISRDMYPALPR
jgi:hypothetical protein